MNKIWKVIGTIAAVAVIGAFVFCTVWTIRNWDTVYKSFDGSSVYTKADIERAEQETWEKAAKNETEYQHMIYDLRDQITESQLNYNRETENLQSIISDYKEIFNLSQEYISSLDLPEKAVVIFENDNGILFDIRIIDQGSTAESLVNQMQIPTKNGYHFIGWSLDGINVIDLSELQVNENVTLIAVFEINTYSVKFVNPSDDVVFLETTVTHGEYFNSDQIAAVNDDVMEYYNYGSNYVLNWKVDGYSRRYIEGGHEIVTSTIDFQIYPITENTVFKLNVTRRGSMGDSPERPFDPSLY